MDEYNATEGQDIDIEALAAQRSKYILNYTVDANGCWIHNNKVNSDGYVCLLYKNKCYKAHVLSYVLVNGPVPENRMVCHTCDVRNCINPEHLYAGTTSSNMRDMYNRGRSPLQYDEDTLAFILVLRDSGYSQHQIASMLGISQTGISNVLRRARNA